MGRPGDGLADHRARAQHDRPWTEGSRRRAPAERRAAAILFDRDFAELVEIIDDMLPFEIAVTARGEAVEQLLPQQHGKEAAEDVTADGRIGFVEDRPAW